MKDTRIGRWTIVEQIGSGGHAYVYKAVDGDDAVAVKWLRPGNVDDSLVGRFKQEAEALRDLDHPSIVRFIDYIHQESNGYHFLVLEYMQHGSIDNQLKDRGALPAARAVPIFHGIMQAVAYAHDVGIIHRDIKPNNLLINDKAEVKLSDFGIARVVGSKKSRFTAQGFVMGTPEYMAPEYLTTSSVTEQADIYSLGVTFFQMLTCHKPFEHDSKKESPIAFVKRVTTEDPPSLNSFLRVEPKLERIIMRAIARDPKKRYKRVAQMISDLERDFPDLVRKKLDIGDDGAIATSMLEVAQLAPKDAPSPAPPAAGRGLIIWLIAGVVLAAGAFFGLGGVAPTLRWVGVAAGLLLGIGGALISRKRAQSAPLGPDEEDDEGELQAFLVLTTGNTRRYPLDPITVIGRDPTCEILLLKDAQVSRKHAHLYYSPDDLRFRVEDLGSTNGTFLNEKRLEPHKAEVLEPGDVVRVGRTPMRFERQRG